jgi:hypothetical protein
MELLITSQGAVRAICAEAFDLAPLGRRAICGVSHVQPDAHGRWHADLGLVGGPSLGPFALRSEALAAELAWLESHWLSPAS